MTTRDHLRFLRLTITPDNGAAFTIENLRIEFEIRVNADVDNAPSVVRVYNLSDRSAATLVAGFGISVEAGYGAPQHLLYRGTLRSVHHERDRVNRITELFLGTVAETGVESELYQHSGPAPYRETVLEIVEAMGEDIDVSTLQLLPAGGGYPRWAINARPRDALTQFLAPLNARWYESNGYIRIAPIEAEVSSATAYISEATSMIGTPTYVQDDATGIRVRVVLTSSIGLGNTVHIDSDLTKGDYVVSTVTHIGDNWHGEWFTEIEADEVIPPEEDE